MMEDLIPILQGCRLFSGLAEDCIRREVLPRGTVRSFSGGQALIEPQQQVDWFAVLLEGRVRITQLFADGASSLMGVLRPSYALGADLLCTDSRRSPYYAIADGPGRMAVFSGELLEASGGLPEEARTLLWRHLTVLLAQENMRKHYRLAILSQRGVRERALVYLTMQAGKKGTSRFRLPFTREELADFLCVNRSALSHELGKMEREGLIRFRKNEFTLLSEGRDRSGWS